MPEIERPRSGCKNYIDSKQKGYILTHIVVIIIAFLVGKNELTDLRIVVAKLETTISNLKEDEKEKVVDSIKENCNVNEYENYCSFMKDTYMIPVKY